MRHNLDDRPMLDLSVNHFRREIGDMLLYGSWWGRDAQQSEPCLVLIPARGRKGAFKPAVVCLSSAWLWRDDPRRSARAAAEFADGMGFAGEMTRIHRITEAIVGHLDDLVRMPPRPHRHEVVGGHAFIRSSETGEIEYAEAVHRI